MTDFRERLLATARRVIPGRDFNRVREEILEGSDPSVRASLVYEAVVHEAWGWIEFRDGFYPPLARYLSAKKYDPADPRGVVLALFSGDQCLLIDAPEAIRILREVDQLDPTVLQVLVRKWVAGG